MFKGCKRRATQESTVRRDLGCAHRCPGEELSLGGGWQCSCHFHDSKNNMVLEEHL